MSEENELESDIKSSAVVAISSMAAILTGEPSKALRTMVQFLKGLVTVYAIPVEMFIHPGFGSRYLDPITVAASVIVMHVVFGLSLLARLFSYTLPERLRPGSGLVGMGILFMLYCAGLVYHLIRVRRLMKDMKLELDSEDDNPPLSFIRALPKGNNWIRVRAYYEPGLVILLSLTLRILHVLDLYATVFLLFCAGALWVKVQLIGYECWLFRRIARDKEYRSKMLKYIFAGKAAPDTFAGHILTPVETPQERAFVAAELTGMRAEYEHLVTRRNAPNGAIAVENA